jgi:hypothetical protein
MIDDDAILPPVVTRGAQLVEDLREGLGPETLVLLEEAGRITDRLDRLDDILTGGRRQWMHFRTREDETVTVVITGALSEARQQAATLQVLMREVRTAKAAASGGTNDANAKRGGSLFDDDDELAPRRAKRS